MPRPAGWSVHIHQMGLDHALVDLSSAKLIKRIHVMDLRLMIIINTLLDLLAWTTIRATLAINVRL